MLAVLLGFLILAEAGAFAGSAVVYVSADAAGLDGLWADVGQFRIDTGLRLPEGFGFRIPVTLAVDLSYGEVNLADFGLFLDYRPLESGPFLSFSLAQLGMFFGRDSPRNVWLCLNEAAVGYTWRFASGWFLEPRVIVRDPTGTFEKEYEEIRDVFPEYSRFRFSLSLGWECPVSDSTRKEGTSEKKGGMKV
jgi:hypothetical protein